MAEFKRTDAPEFGRTFASMGFDSSKPHGSRHEGSRRSDGFAPRRPAPAKGTYVIGYHPVMEALDAGKEFQRVMIQRDEKSDRTGELLNALRTHEVPVQRVPREKLDRITRKNHQGVIAFLSPIAFQPLEELIARAYELGEAPLFIVLDGVTDVRNLGAIARSAECFGATGLVIPTQGVAPIQEDAIKSSSGALMRLPVARSENIASALELMTANGITTVALTEKGAESLTKTPIPRPACLVMGDEERGISNAVLAACSQRVFVPMAGQTASLNVSVAAGIALYHVSSSAD